MFLTRTQRDNELREGVNRLAAGNLNSDPCQFSTEAADSPGACGSAGVCNGSKNRRMDITTSKAAHSEERSTGLIALSRSGRSLASATRGIDESCAEASFPENRCILERREQVWRVAAVGVDHGADRDNCKDNPE